MPVQWENMDFPFHGGVNEKIASEILPPGLLQTAKNVRQRKSGEVKPRYGYTDLGRTVAGESANDHVLQDVNSIHARSSKDLIVYGYADDDGTADPSMGEGFYRFSDTTDEFHRAGPGTPCDIGLQYRSAVSQSPIRHSTAYPHYSGTTWADKTLTHTVVVNVDSANPEIRIYDANGEYIPPQGSSNNRISSSDVTNKFCAGMSVFTGSQNEWVLWYIDAAADVYYYRIDMSQPQLYGSTASFSTGTFSHCVTCEVQSDPDQHIVAYVDTANATVIVNRVDNTQTASWTTTLLSGALNADTGDAPALVYDSANSRVHVFHRDSASGEIFHAGLALSDGSVEVGNGGLTDASSTGISVDPGVITAALDPQYGSNEVRIFVNIDADDYYNTTGGETYSYLYDVTDQAETSASAQHFYVTQIIGQAFTYNNKAYCWLTYNNAVDDNRAYLVSTRESSTGTIEPELVAGFLDGFMPNGVNISPSNATEQVSQSYEISTGKWGFLCPYAANVVGAAGEYGVAEVTVDFKPYPIQSVQIGPQLLCGGGVLHSVSGTSTENGFLCAPYISVAASAGGGSITAGSHSFKVVAIWVDDSGEVHRSSPSNAATASFSANDQATLTVNFPNVTNRIWTDVDLEVYVTEAAGTIHYYAGIMTCSEATSFNQTKTIAADATLITKAILYTDQGELGAGRAPPTTRLAAGNGRAMCIPSDNRRVVQYTKPKVPGIAAEWPLQFRKDLFPTKDLEAIAYQDGKWIVWSADEILWFSGEGENAWGVGRFSDVYKIPTNVGAVSPIVLTTQEGTYFYSRKGLCLLDRSLQIHYAGAPIEDSNSDSFYSMVSVGDEREYRFIHGTDTTNANAVSSLPAATELAVYDSHHGQWYRDDLIDALGSGGTLLDATVWNGAYVLATRTGASSDTVRIVKEDSTVFQDWGTNYDRQIQTGWVRPAGMNGFVRCRRVGIFGDWVSTHTLGLTIYAREDSSTADETASFALTSDPGEYRYRSRVNNQKTTAIMIDLTVSGASGEAFKWYGLTFEFGLKRGIRKLSPTVST